MDVCASKVHDTGIGIAQEAQERIFKAFSQADGTTTRRYGGTGLGLAISKQLVEIMGGEIALVSTPYSGSTFSFTLPVRSGTAVWPAMIRHAALRDIRVLIVDDNATNCSILQRQVSSLHMRSECAANADAGGLEMLRKATAMGEPCELAILDMIMPGMNGLELAGAIKVDPKFAALPIVMLTSLSEDCASEASNQDGIAAYLTKPVRNSTL